MNSILQLKGRFEHRPNPSRPGSPKLPQGKSVSVEHVKILCKQLSEIRSYWTENTVIGGALVSVYYTSVVAKSNRLKILLSENSDSPLESIRGAKFVREKDEKDHEILKHVFTHYISLKALDHTIELLTAVSNILNEGYLGNITSEDVDEVAERKKYRYESILSRTAFLKVVVDSYYTDRFEIDRANENSEYESIVTIYQTDIETKTLLSKFGIDIVDDRIIDGTTIRLRPDELKILYNSAPYLVAMSVTDLSEITLDDIEDDTSGTNDSMDIPKPNNEPVIGVIDTLFNENVYFHEWVEFVNLVDPNIPITEEDYRHGTAVSYIIVDGPKGNPKLDDGCGRFRVRHFGVATHNGFSSFTILRQIRSIVSKNRDIKVWNLSFGSKLEIKENFISPEAYELDRIQSEYDVIFVVAGTNKPSDFSGEEMRIGSPADSLNSVVVNAVDMDGKTASYSRRGPVLSFFHKPDISYYGGDGKNYESKMAVCINNLGASYMTGTSFSAPWIARKLSYLIDVLNLSRELAKALIIDSAANWYRKDYISPKMGYGVVPVHIDDIIHTSNDEIRFMLMGTTDEYETYTYNLPVPMVSNAHPFYARATLVYFPHCNRNQGVDYTNTEMDIHFGRIDNGGHIKSINNNTQSDAGFNPLFEAEARRMYRKWDNIKFICDEIKPRAVPRKAYSSGMWGISIKTKERMQGKIRDSLPFGVVITLKEMNGINRIDDFIKLSMARGWIVNKLDVENQINVYAKAEEEITFE